MSDNEKPKSDDKRTLFCISCAGERSVGIPAQSTEVRVYVAPGDTEYLEFVREELRTCFTHIWDEPASVITGEEYEEELRAEARMFSERGSNPDLVSEDRPLPDKE